MTDDPFRKVQEELKDVDFGSVDREQLGASDSAASEVTSLHRNATEAAATPPPDDDLEARLAQFEERARLASGKRNVQKKAIETERSTLQGDARGMGMGLTIAYIIVGTPMAGALVGWLIDMQAGSNVAKGFGTLIGAVIGIAYAVFLLNRPAPRP